MLRFLLLRVRLGGASLAALVAVTALVTGSPLLISAGGSAPSERPQHIELGANARGLFPGAKAKLRVSIDNPHRFPISVKRVAVFVQPQSPDLDCPAEQYLRLGEFDGPVTVGKRDTKTVTIPLILRTAAPDSCQGRVFPLRLRATAVKSK